MKYIKIIAISFCIIIILSNNAMALSEILDTSEDWKQTGQFNAGTTMDSEKLRDGSKALYNILLTAAMVVAVIVGAFLGIQYMMAGISEKVEVKKSLLPYLISCIVVFGSMGIWKLVVKVLGQV